MAPQWELLSASVDRTPVSSASYLLLGDAGAGKSTMLNALAQAARRQGFRVLQASGRPVGGLVSFDLLVRLIRPLVSEVSWLPAGQRQALASLLAGPDEPTAGAGAQGPDPGMLRLAVLAVLGAAAESTPVLLLIDDLHEIDRGSYDVLMSVARRLAEEPVLLIMAARGGGPSAGLPTDCVVLTLAPLNDAHAAALLDRLPNPPRGRGRLEVLRTAGGNPLALVELARAERRAGLPSASLPLSDVLIAVFGAELRSLPEATRWALLLAAAGESRLEVLARHPLGIQASVLAPAVDSGAIVIIGDEIRFRHPLLESIVYQQQPVEVRRRAHELLAAALPEDIGRQAWHQGAGQDRPREEVARVLTGYAEQIRRRGDALTAAAVLERAAELTPVARARGWRQLEAAQCAAAAGNTSWCLELASAAAAANTDPDLLLQAAMYRGWGLNQAGHPDAGARIILDALEGALGQDPPLDPALLYDVLNASGLPVYVQGSSALLARAGALGGRLNRSMTQAQLDRHQTMWLWPTALAAPGKDVHELVLTVPVLAPDSDPDRFARAGNYGAAAYVLDETRLAIEHLAPIVALVSSGVTMTPSMSAFPALGWALLDAGRLADAAENAERILQVNAVPDLAMIAATGLAQRVIAALSRGAEDTEDTEDTEDAEDALGADRDGVLTSELASVEVRVAQARARAAAARGEDEQAWAHLLGTFRADGSPRHAHWAPRLVADIARAGARTGRREEAAALVTSAVGESDWVTHRCELLRAVAYGLLAPDPATAEEWLRSAAEDERGDQWPVERGLAQLDLADLLQRTRRRTEARTVLQRAVATFERTGARAWERRARAELRAAGVQTEPVRSDRLELLTAQQQQIVRMAAQGLTNREIGDRIFLSPRTVGSHLYRAFPKLGITSRAQLPTVIPAGPAATEPGI